MNRNRQEAHANAFLVLRAASRLVGAVVLTLVAGVAAAKATDDQSTGKDEALEARFDAAIDPAAMDGWLETMAAEPNHVGSAHDQANAEFILAHLREWGWDAQIETFEVLYPIPQKVSLDLFGKASSSVAFSATLTEPPIAGDDPTETHDALPAYLAYQGDGDVTAPLVYANYGMPDDYDTLERLGVSVEGKIVITRYGGGWRGLKPKLAQEHGAVGCIIYSDPGDDGYSTDDVYPRGEARPPQGLQRGSVMDMTTYPGDPLTPGVGASADAQRLQRSESAVILKIPAIPISYRDAHRFLAALGGQLAPRPWRGSLDLTYHVGGDEEAPKAHLVVRSDWSLRTIRDVVAKMPGSEWPDQWVLRGNHFDGWVMGAGDPLSGQIALLAEAKAIGELAKAGWRPRRTLVYLAWDAEEPGLIGSTEWAETHADELRAKAVLYVNTDGNARGFLGVGGSHSLQHFVNQVAADVIDPETQVSVGQRLRARWAVRGLESASPQAKKLAAIAAAPGKDLPIQPLGSGSDYSVFLQHLGLAALNVGYGGEGNHTRGGYHSLYDDYARQSRFADPGAVYSATLAKTVGRIVLRAADADLPPQRYADFAGTVADYLDEVKKLADVKREAANAQAKTIEAGFFALADDPTKPRGEPTALKNVPHFNFAPLEDAVDRLQASARAFDAALAERGAQLADADKARLFDLAREAEEALAPSGGLPGRPWYRNLIYAPGTLTGYGAKTLPGVREAIEQERWEDVDRYAALSAAALQAYADKLDAGVELLRATAPTG